MRSEKHSGADDVMVDDPPASVPVVEVDLRRRQDGPALTVDLRTGTTERRAPTAGVRFSWAHPHPYVDRQTAVVGPEGPITPRRVPVGGSRPAVAWRRTYASRACAGDLLSWFVAVGAATATLPLGMTPAALIVIGGGVAWVLALAVTRGYDERRLGAGPEELQAVMRATWLVVAGSAVLAYTLHADFPRRLVFVAIPVAGVVAALHRHLLRKGLHRDRVGGRSMQRTLVVGDLSSIRPVCADLGQATFHGYQVVGACTPAGVGDASGSGPATLGAIADVPQVVVDWDVDVVIVAGAQLVGQALRRLSWALDRVGADLVVSPGVVEVAGPHVTVRPTAGLSLLHLEQPSRHQGRELGKMVLDRVLGSVLLVLAGLPLAVMAVAVAATDGGGVFFRQQRAGVDGRPFTLWKLRTMVVDAEQRREQVLADSDRDGPMFKMRADPRVTPVGRWLRRFSLDELPQLWNVVRGDMSLVGPRPPLMTEVEQYHDAANRRLRVRPGLTGLWQVSGRADLDWEQSVNLDLRYVDNWSLALDLQILWKTVRAVVHGSGAY